MSGHNALQEQMNAVFEMPDPGDTGTVRIDRDRAIVPLIAVTAETRTVAAPLRAGLVLTLQLRSGGGSVTATITGGYDVTGNTTVELNDNGDFFTFISVDVEGSFYWRLMAHNGPTLNYNDVTNYGAIATAYMLWDASANQLDLMGPVRLRGANDLSPRFELTWVSGARGLPQLNAVMDAAAANTYSTTGLQAMWNADVLFEVLGTNASSDDVTAYAEGGIKLETDGADNDQVIILPHLNAGQSVWTGVTWGTDKQTEWSCHIKTGSAITATTIWAGLKLTNTSVAATDDDQAFFRYAAATASGVWQAIYSIAGTDTTVSASVTVAADTEYYLKIAIDSSRVARFWINGALVATSTALTTEKDLIPYIGIHANAVAAKHMYIFGESISRVVG